MGFDEMVHKVYEQFCNHKIGVRWHDFHGVGIDEDYYDYYYAENQLYVIRDRIMEKFWFVEARSPREALDKMNDLADDIGMAMSGPGEEFCL